MRNETIIKELSLHFEHYELDSDTDNYNITSIEEFHSKNMNTFGIKISFERNWKGTVGILINYHMMCAMLVLVGSINFLIEPNVVPGRAGHDTKLLRMFSNGGNV